MDVKKNTCGFHAVPTSAGFPHSLEMVGIGTDGNSFALASLEEFRPNSAAATVSQNSSSSAHIWPYSIHNSCREGQPGLFTQSESVFTGQNRGSMDAISNI